MPFAFVEGCAEVGRKISVREEEVVGVEAKLPSCKYVAPFQEVGLRSGSIFAFRENERALMLMPSRVIEVAAGTQ